MTKRNDYYKQMIDGFLGMHRSLSPRGSELGNLPAGQRAALVAVAIHGQINVKHLAELLYITPGAATQHVSSLESSGLAVRSVDPNDRRGVIIELSNAGSDYVSQLEVKTLQLLKEASTDVSDKDLETFVTVLKKISTKLRST